MTPTEQKTAARKFVERWQQAEGNEQREANSFWIELCSQVLGIANPTQCLDFERKVKGRRIDVFYEDRSILIENKSRGVSLGEPELRGKDKRGNPRYVTPFEQAKWYADNITPRSVMPKYVITCNFDEIRIHDLDKENAEDDYEVIELDDIPNQIHRLSFFRAKENSRMEREKELSVAAGEVVGKLYDAFAGAYLDIANDKDEQRSLNILITRIVFLLYAEDADILKERNQFYKFLKGFQVNHMRQALIDLFGVLNTPKEERDPYIDADLDAFPYVNGGLFADQIIVPQFDENTRFLLLQEASAEFDWADISPTIFGAVFESTLNPETRRSGGMHFTSVESIHKLTGPLFYDALKDELTAIEGAATEKERKFKLNAFRNKIASLKFLDPACGSGNFLTETYLTLRKLENRVLEDLYGDQMVMSEADPIRVQVSQFYGIEVNDFAVEVAKTALWIAELRMLDQTREILSMWIDPLPLKSNDNIVCANALRTDWNDVLPAGECDYVIGNPPFVGAYRLDKDQQADRADIFGKSGGVLDYVACWYKRAAEYTVGTPARCAFVSTNSICQGQQVEPLWKPLFADGIHIDFAYRTFVWNSEALDQAHVHVVIIGFSREDGIPKLLFDGDKVERPQNINGYLADAPSVFVEKHSKPLCDVPDMAKGFQATDNGYLLMYEAERDALLAKEPEAARWIRPFSMGADFVNGDARYCLFLEGAGQEDIDALSLVKERVEACRAWRSEQTPTGDAYKLKDTPHLLRPCNKFHDKVYIGVPVVTSGNRKYVPLGFVTDGMIPGNKLYFVETDSLYHFGVMSSQFHNAWMRMVTGRMKSDYNYSNTIVYNDFVWPDLEACVLRGDAACAEGQAEAGVEGQAEAGVEGQAEAGVEGRVLRAPEQLKAATKCPRGAAVGGTPSAAASRQGLSLKEEIERCAQGVLDARANHPDNTLAEMYDGVSPLPENPSEADRRKYDLPEFSDLKAAHAALDAAVEAAYGVDFGGDEERIVAHLFKLYAQATQDN